MAMDRNMGLGCLAEILSGAFLLCDCGRVTLTLCVLFAWSEMRYGRTCVIRLCKPRAQPKGCGTVCGWGKSRLLLSL